jgi:hypothetical protein
MNVSTRLLTQALSQVGKSKIIQVIIQQPSCPGFNSAHGDPKLDSTPYQRGTSQCNVIVAAAADIEGLARVVVSPGDGAAGEDGFHIMITGGPQTIAQILTEGDIVLVGSKAPWQKLCQTGFGRLLDSFLVKELSFYAVERKCAVGPAPIWVQFAHTTPRVQCPRPGRVQCLP